MEFSNISVKEQDTNKNLSGAAEPIPNGWYRIALIDESELKRTRQGDRMGQMLTFVVNGGKYSGYKFSVWITCQVQNAADAWAVAQTETLIYRIAKCCAVDPLNNTKQLKNINFIAYLVQRENVQKIKKTNPETGEIEVSEIKRVNMNFDGNADQNILSVEEFMAKHASQNATQNQKKFVKKSAEPTGFDPSSDISSFTKEEKEEMSDIPF